MIYNIQQRIHTLSSNAVMDIAGPANFSVQGVNFSHWQFSYGQGWSHNYWIAQSKVESLNLEEALKDFGTRLIVIVPRIALIGQCYVDFNQQPVLAIRSDVDVAWLRYTEDTKGVSLAFGGDELKALNLLLNNVNVPEEFLPLLE